MWRFFWDFIMGMSLAVLMSSDSFGNFMFNLIVFAINFVSYDVVIGFFDRGH